MSVFRFLVLVVVFVGLGPAVAGAGESAAQRASTVDSTGAADVTADLQSLIDSAPDGGRVRLEPQGRYRVEGTLLIENRRDLEIEGNGAKVFATTTGSGDRSHLRLVGGSGIAIRNLRIDGANPHAGLDDRAYQVDLVGQHGIRVEGASDVELDRVFVSDVYGDFVYLGRDKDAIWSQRVWIHDSVFARSGRQGLTVTAASDVVIERNVITHTRRATIDLEPNSPTWGARNIHIIDNEIGPGRLLFVAMAGRGPVDQVVVQRNQLEGHLLNMIVEPPPGARRSTFYVIDNISDTPATRTPLRFTNVDGLVVLGNTQPVTRDGEAGVSAVESCDVLVTDNDLEPSDLQSVASPPCGTPPPREPPPPPQLVGRDPSRATTTTSDPPAPPTTPAVSEAAGPVQPRSFAEPDTASPLAITAAITLILASVAAAISGFVRRSRRAGGRRTTAPSPPP